MARNFQISISASALAFRALLLSRISSPPLAPSSLYSWAQNVLTCLCSQVRCCEVDSHTALHPFFCSCILSPRSCGQIRIVESSSVSDLAPTDCSLTTSCGCVYRHLLHFIHLSHTIFDRMNNKFHIPELFVRSDHLEPCGDGGPSFEWR